MGPSVKMSFRKAFLGCWKATSAVKMGCCKACLACWTTDSSIGKPPRTPLFNVERGPCQWATSCTTRQNSRDVVPTLHWGGTGGHGGLRGGGVPGKNKPLEPFRHGAGARPAGDGRARGRLPRPGISKPRHRRGPGLGTGANEKLPCRRAAGAGLATARRGGVGSRGPSVGNALREGEGRRAKEQTRNSHIRPLRDLTVLAGIVSSFSY